VDTYSEYRCVRLSLLAQTVRALIDNSAAGTISVLIVLVARVLADICEHKKVKENMQQVLKRTVPAAPDKNSNELRAGGQSSHPTSDSQMGYAEDGRISHP